MPCRGIGFLPRAASGFPPSRGRYRVAGQVPGSPSSLWLSVPSCSLRSRTRRAFARGRCVRRPSLTGRKRRARTPGAIFAAETRRYGAHDVGIQYCHGAILVPRYPTDRRGIILVKSALTIDASIGVQATQIACPPLCIGDTNVGLGQEGSGRRRAGQDRVPACGSRH